MCVNQPFNCLKKRSSPKKVQRRSRTRYRRLKRRVEDDHKLLIRSRGNQSPRLQLNQPKNKLRKKLKRRRKVPRTPHLGNNQPNRSEAHRKRRANQRRTAKVRNQRDQSLSRQSPQARVSLCQCKLSFVKLDQILRRMHWSLRH